MASHTKPASHAGSLEPYPGEPTSQMQQDANQNVYGNSKVVQVNSIMTYDFQEGSLHSLGSGEGINAGETYSIGGNDFAANTLKTSIIQPLLGESERQEGCPGDNLKYLNLAINVSLVVNVVLLAAKIGIYIVTMSNSIFATVADSVVDILSQAVIAFAAYQIKLKHPKYPVGRTRLETVGVIVSAGIMSVCSIEVIQSAFNTLWDGFALNKPHYINIDMLSYIILGLATLLKVILYILCASMRKKSASALALAEDHLNDVLSNSMAIFTAALASSIKQIWWIDAVGGSLIAFYIICRWILVAQEHIEKLVGKEANENFIEQVKDMTHDHHHAMLLDAIRAYFFGQKYIVELEVILPANMSVKHSHDIALALQHKVEAHDEVERAFVHVDYQCRDEPEHKVERMLERGNSSSPSERAYNL